MNNQHPQHQALDPNGVLAALPDPTWGIPAKWIPAGLPTSERTLLSKVVPDGPRGAGLALQAFALLIERLGSDAVEVSELTESVRSLRHAELQPTATDQPLSHFVCQAVALGPSVDLWTVWALPALWAARQATSTALASERPLARLSGL